VGHTFEAEGDDGAPVARFAVPGVDLPVRGVAGEGDIEEAGGCRLLSEGLFEELFELGHWISFQC